MTKNEVLKGVEKNTVVQVKMEDTSDSIRLEDKENQAPSKPTSVAPPIPLQKASGTKPHEKNVRPRKRRGPLRSGAAKPSTGPKKNCDQGVGSGQNRQRVHGALDKSETRPTEVKSKLRATAPVFQMRKTLGDKTNA